jgi:hypothetical protein
MVAFLKQLIPIAVLISVVAWPTLAAPEPSDELDHFNYVLGTQTFDPSYQFTKQTPLVETAEAIQALGSTVIKFGLIPKGQSAFHSLTELARDEPSRRHVLDMPFAYFVIWMHTYSNPGGGSWRNGFSQTAQTNEYREVYDLVAYLLKTYDGSGKTFYLGHWEGDGMLRGSIGKEFDVRATPTAIQGMIDWLTVRQRAADDAKRDTPHHNVQVWHYTEVNHVTPARDEGRPTLVNKVLPRVPVDFVSYSSYDTSNFPRPDNIKSALDYIESKLTPKPGITGKRVFIGEYGYPILKKTSKQNAHTPQEQEALSRIVMLAGLEWGCPFVLYWEMYNNEVNSDGSQRGYWMIDDKGVKQPIYETHRRYFDWAHHFVAAEISRTGQSPDDVTFRTAAVNYLKAPENNAK